METALELLLSLQSHTTMHVINHDNWEVICVDAVGTRSWSKIWGM
jgi:hypothetical protein